MLHQRLKDLLAAADHLWRCLAALASLSWLAILTWCALWARCTLGSWAAIAAWRWARSTLWRSSSCDWCIVAWCRAWRSLFASGRWCGAARLAGTLRCGTAECADWRSNDTGRLSAHPKHAA
jgi:hypothetical protein